MRCNQVTTIWLKLCKKEMVEGYNGKIVKFNSIHTGCKHSLSNMVPKLNKYICCSAQFFFSYQIMKSHGDPMSPTMCNFKLHNTVIARQLLSLMWVWHRFIFFHFLQLTGSHNYQGLLPSIPPRAAGTRGPFTRRRVSPKTVKYFVVSTLHWHCVNRA